MCVKPKFFSHLCHLSIIDINSNQTRTQGETVCDPQGFVDAYKKESLTVMVRVRTTHTGITPWCPMQREGKFHN